MAEDDRIELLDKKRRNGGRRCKVDRQREIVLLKMYW